VSAYVEPCALHPGGEPAREDVRSDGGERSHHLISMCLRLRSHRRSPPVPPAARNSAGV
jgi:hypothetical protein